MYLLGCSSRSYDHLPDSLRQRTGCVFRLVRTPDELDAELSRVEPLAAFFPHWSHIIPKRIHQNAKCVIFHMTDLPYGRGGSPLQNLIVRGHHNTVISALLCGEGVDTGPVFLKRPLSLGGSAREIFARAAIIIEDMIVDLVRNPVGAVEQQGEVVTFRRRTPSESNMSELAELGEVYNHIRMLDADGYPNAFLEFQGLRMEFCDARLEGDHVSARVKISKSMLQGSE